MNILDELLYNESHEWIRVEDNIATVGITDFAQSELGDIVFVELPEIGMSVNAGEPCGSIEAVKAVEDLISPLSGEIIEYNGELEDSPDLINKSAYDEGWIMKIEISEMDELENLMSAADYKRMISD